MRKPTLTFFNGSTNSRVRISNLPTHFLLLTYQRGYTVLANRLERVYLPKEKRRAIYDLVRLRMVRRGELGRRV